jgi:hypothetical protein
MEIKVGVVQKCGHYLDYVCSYCHHETVNYASVVELSIRY